MPRTRQGVTVSSDEDEVNNSLTMPQEVLKSLLASLQKSQQQFCTQLMKEIRSSTPDQSATFSGVSAHGNFTQSTTRFSRSPKEPSDNFWDAVQVYKSYIKVSDEDTLKGFSMLLTGSAAVWWQGVKLTTVSWTEAVTWVVFVVPRRLAYGFIYCQRTCSPSRRLMQE